MKNYIVWIRREDLTKLKTNGHFKLNKKILTTWLLPLHIVTTEVKNYKDDNLFIEKVGVLLDTSQYDSVVDVNIDKRYCKIQNVIPLRLIENIEEYRETMEGYNNERLK